MSDEQVELTDEQIAAARAARAEAIVATLKLKNATIETITANRATVKTAQRTDSLCLTCGGSYTRRGYCTNCGAKA